MAYVSIQTILEYNIDVDMLATNLFDLTQPRGPRTKASCVLGLQRQP